MRQRAFVFSGTFAEVMAKLEAYFKAQENEA
jgi:hypothetical protein